MTDATDPTDPTDPIRQLAAVPPAVPAPLSAELERELAQLAPVAPRRPRRQLAIAVAASLAYAGGLLALLALRDDLHGLPVAWIVAAASLWLAGFVVPLYLALVPRAGSVMPRWTFAAGAAAIAAVGFVSLGLVIHPSVPGVSRDYGWTHLLRGHWCLWLGLATAIAPIAIATWFVRGAVVVRSRWIAAAIGAGGGALGGMLLHFHCPIADGPHVGLVHGGVVGVAALLSAAFATRTLVFPMREDQRS